MEILAGHRERLQSHGYAQNSQWVAGVCRVARRDGQDGRVGKTPRPATASMMDYASRSRAAERSPLDHRSDSAMATIILAPGERFTHYHDDANASCCVKGEVRVSFGDTERMVGPGERVAIPAGVRHTLHNIGNAPAHVECAHQPPEHLPAR